MSQQQESIPHLYTPVDYSLKRKSWFDSNEIGLTLLSACWFLFGAYIACLANAYLDYSNPSLRIEIERRVRLPDPLLEFLSPIYYKKLKLSSELSDILVRIAPVIFLSRSLLMKNKSLLILRRLFYTLGAAYLIRAPFVLMTVLPNPLVTCISHPEPQIFYDALLLLILRRNSCGDVLFSGHTLIFMLAGLTWVDYPPKNRILARLIPVLACLFTGISILVLIGSTFHYTVDCVFGVIVILIIWRGYHFIVTTHYCDNTWYSNLLVFCDGERDILFLKPELGYELCNTSLV